MNCNLNVTFNVNYSEIKQHIYTDFAEQKYQNTYKDSKDSLENEAMKISVIICSTFSMFRLRFSRSVVFNFFL